MGPCEYCGCTEEDACIDHAGLPCVWVEPYVCSACADELDAAGFPDETPEPGFRRDPASGLWLPEGLR